MKRVLIVDDSLVDRDYLKGIVESEGCKALLAENTEQAYDLAQRHSPDVIFMDVVMEGENGYEACRRMQQDAQLKQTPLYFVSSKNQRVDRVWGALLGAKGWIAKPADQDKVKDALKA